MKNKIIKWLDFNFQISLEANRVTFKHMILSMMNANEKVAEDIIDVVENHYIARS